MSDRQLMEDAARAYGIQIEYWSPDGNGVSVAYYTENGLRKAFQPLHENQITDRMGDALRLAVKLGIQVDPRAPETRVYGSAGEVMREYHKPDACAATCRAVVRAAAEIWRVK